MTTAPENAIQRPAPVRRTVVPNAIVGTLIFIVSEAMMFSGMVSAYTIARSGTPEGLWPPPAQPRLPVEETLVNTIALLLSGALMFVAWRRYKQRPDDAKAPFAAAYLLGAFFVASQGVEWSQLIGQGMVIQSSTHASFFYLIVGTHGLHAIGGLVMLTVLGLKLRAGNLRRDVLWAGSLFWYFVVLLWPLLYWQVYL